MKINIGKSNGMRYRAPGGNELLIERERMNGGKLNEGDDFKYLGLTVSQVS